MSKNERAFAIQASPEVIWGVLTEEIEAGVDAGRARVEHQERPRSIAFVVQLGWGLSVRYQYRISTEVDHTEVAVEVTPFGFRHAIANIISFGRGSTPLMVAATQGLANLKDEAEREAARQRGGS
ncbi:MAG TPA: hypothetical protein QGF05_13245 [Dehalococcoidia bacterium]|nr:hypothetical protein [Dehalococcoidia bacterium]